MNQTKRLVLCCDGTWMDADDGFEKPTLIPYVPTGSLQIPSNVTRISRALKKTGLDGKPQIVSYHSGVGTGSSTLDTITGGFLGSGISENIREVYYFIAANYAPGDEIILIGFSRGAFTVRSVASIIRDIGLLTSSGMESFYPIFKDQQNFRNPRYNDIFPTIPFSRKPKNAQEYTQRLLEDELTRVTDPDGSFIRVQAVAVWDTVGSLGIPNTTFLSKIGLPHSSKEYKFYDTSLSGIIRHAFQALALDEQRAPFSPAVWERKDMDHTTIDLRQVWFPGAHSNVGGGYPDQEVANISLAWMMDQLASIGVAFHSTVIEKIFDQSVSFYEDPPPQRKSLSNFFSPRPRSKWAITPIYEKHKPIRPFGLGAIVESKTGIWNITGKTIRTPGLYKRADPDTGVSTGVSMLHTNERIHSSVRIRLELQGLDPGDVRTYRCPALTENGRWRLREVRLKPKIKDPIPWDAQWGKVTPIEPPDDFRWVWEYDGPGDRCPKVRVMIEENLGPYQKELLLLNKGKATYKRRRKRIREQTYRDKVFYDVPERDREKYRDDRIDGDGESREYARAARERYVRRHYRRVDVVYDEPVDPLEEMMEVAYRIRHVKKGKGRQREGSEEVVVEHQHDKRQWRDLY